MSEHPAWLSDPSVLEITCQNDPPMSGEARLVTKVAFQVIGHALEHSGGDLRIGEPKSILRMNLEASLLCLHQMGYRIKGIPVQVKEALRSHYGDDHVHVVDAVFG